MVASEAASSDAGSCSGPGDAEFGVVLAAAGDGKRFGRRKQYLDLAGRPLVEYSLEVFSALRAVRRLVLVAPSGDLPAMDRIVRSWSRRERHTRRAGDVELAVVAGGTSRQESVQNGLRSLSGFVRWALVHDAARPLVLPADVERVMEAIRVHGAAALGYPVTDSVKEESGGWVRRGLDREHVWQVQTPQGGVVDELLRAYEALSPGEVRTDEVALLEGAGVSVKLVLGSRENMKVTLPGDEELAEYLLARRLRDERPA